MIFLADMVVDIHVYEGKVFIIYCSCSAMESIIINGIFLYGTHFTVDLVQYLSVLMFHSNIGSCSPDAFVCSVDGTRSSSILLHSLPS